MDDLRIGLGYDIHALEQGRKLVLGGVQVPAAAGLVGHSDGDVLIHAIMDALLGAVGLGDIGTHFPPDDPAYKDAYSLGLLERVRDLLETAGWRAAQVSAVIVAERPRLSPHVLEMRANIAGVLGTGEDAVGIQVTTNEGLGALGRGEGIASWATALVRRHDDRS
jgi:2-C-methyl-D-erythritol 2,4-cyclodiphosphate synthase